MKKFLLGPALAALAMFFWGFAYWGAPHHLPYKTLGTVADVSATALSLGKLFPASGAYLLPSPVDGEEKMNELARRGPSVEIHILKEGYGGAETGTTMAVGYGQLFVLCVLLSAMLSFLAKAFERWTCRVKFCAFLGLLVAVCDFGQAIWWHHSLGWTSAHAFYDFGAYLIAGLVLAKFVTPKAAAPAA